MHQPGKWWVGLIPLAIVWIACAVATTKRIEENAGAAALAAVVALGPDILDNPGVTVSGRDATFTGQTFDTPDTTLRAAAEGATGVRLVHVATVPTPTAKPYTIAFLRDGGDVVLSGNVPSPSERAELLAAATKSAAPSPVIDKLVYATGAPLGFKLMAMSGIEQTAALTSGRMSLSDNGFSIPGLAATTLSYEAALSAAQKFPAGFTLTKADILPPLKQPYAWSAQKNADGISLGGDAPTLESRAASATAAAALFAGAAVKNNLGIARGAPAGDFGAMTGLALGALTRLTSGTAILTDGSLTLTGEAPGFIGHDIEAALQSKLPRGFVIAGVDVKDLPVTPYLFKIEKADGIVRLSGFVPDDETHASFLAAAQAAFFNEQIDDSLRRGSGAPSFFADAVTSAFSAMGRLADGVLSISGRSVDLKGQAVYGKAATDIRLAFLGGLPANFQGQVVVGVKPPGPALPTAACQPAFDGLLAKGKILFETGGDTLQKSSQSILDTLTGTAQRCPQAAIEVAGHTDSDGAPEMNLELSERRAKAVVAYLADAGIDVSRISARGYGAQKPLASNETPEGKAQNRRIEFIVK